MTLELLPSSSTTQVSPPSWSSRLNTALLEQQLLQHEQQQDEEASRSGKRSRVALACQRCKVRKQKCDGSHPCGKCRSINHECEYVMPQKPMAFGKNRYIKALEQRVAELETVLATQGMADLSSDHWQGSSAGMVAAAPTSVAGTSEAEVRSEPKSDAGQDDPDDMGDPDEAVLDWREGVDSVVSVLRSLSLDVNGSGYVGASSHIALGKLFSFVGTRRHDMPGTQRRNSRQQSISHIRTSSSTAGAQEAVDLTDVSPETAEQLFTGYLKHIATRWPVIHSVWARDVHERRHSLTDVYETMMLHLIYATAGRFIETTGEQGDFRAKNHYASAVRSLDTILEFNDLRSITALMLMAVYCLRDAAGAGAWTYSRTALLIAIDRGMHRQTKALSRLSLESELRKRLFWACYSFDRQISIPMGRPFGISDRDVDVDLPLDIDEGISEEQLTAHQDKRDGFSTSLTSFVHVTRLRQIESDIQQTIYRVDNDVPIDDSVIDKFLRRLEQWKAMIPEDTRHFKDAAGIPFDGYDYYMVFFYKCQRLLLYPQLSKTTVAPRFLKECAKACAGVCGTYKRLHQALAVGYSLMSLQTVFMAGLTLVYCIWLSPDDIFDIVTSNGINDCSIVLFVIAERVPSAKRYRNAFEVIRQRVIDSISQQPRRREVVPGLAQELAAPSSYSSQSNMPFEANDGSYEEFSRIIQDMTGEDFLATAFGTAADEATPHHMDSGSNDLFKFTNVEYGHGMMSL